MWMGIQQGWQLQTQCRRGKDGQQAARRRNQRPRKDRAAGRDGASESQATKGPGGGLGPSQVGEAWTGGCTDGRPARLGI